MPYWVYILKSESTGQFYVGQTNDVEDRLRRHNAGRVTATRNRGPWQLGYREEHPTRPAAGLMVLTHQLADILGTRVVTSGQIRVVRDGADPRTALPAPKTASPGP
ncbi:MAG TPA: GIY-YIG nuclease family protein [Candidatus Methylomirabilis sp.]|nr:GIY-YIG nuclease family protein [Candidatus Methylomirabilis sp.]